VEPEGSLPRLQEPTTCPYPKPDQSSPCPAITLPEDPSEYYPLICAWVFQVGSFPQFSPTKIPYAPLFSLSSLRPQVKHVSHYANIRETQSCTTFFWIDTLLNFIQIGCFFNIKTA